MITTKSQQPSTHPGKTRGFTLVELLVVIGCTITLLLPAVQQVREAADRVQPHHAGLHFAMQDGAVRFEAQVRELEALLDSGEIDPTRVADQHAKWIELLDVVLDLQRQASSQLARATTREEREALREAESSLGDVATYTYDMVGQLETLEQRLR